MYSREKFLIKLLLFFLIGWVVLTFFYSQSKADSADNLPVVIQELVKPPFVPKHDIVATGGPKVIKVRMKITEKVMEIDDEGTKFRVFAFK